MFCLLFTSQMLTLLVVPCNASVNGGGGSELKRVFRYISHPDICEAAADSSFSILRWSDGFLRCLNRQRWDQLTIHKTK